MREWLSGGVSPCQGEGRGFESRLALFYWLEVLEFSRVPAFFCFLKFFEKYQVWKGDWLFCKKVLTNQII